MRLIFISLFSVLFFSCGGSNNQSSQTVAKDTTSVALRTLKGMVTSGDLVVRLTDEFISYQVRAVNEQDKTYSHAGLVIEHNHQKYIAHISPDYVLADTIEYLPIDSFLNPVKTVSCALYRYNLSAVERDSLTNFIGRLKNDGVCFDRLYDLNTDSVMYCSEMISKALKSATNGRINCKLSTVPSSMRKLIRAYFKGTLPMDTIVNRKIMTIDNLYLRPDCSLLSKVNLKKSP